jgi:hypothetical protein
MPVGNPVILETAMDAGNKSLFSTGPLTLLANTLVTLSISTKVHTGNQDQPIVASVNRTWELIARIIYVTDAEQIDVFRTMRDVGDTGAITMDYGAPNVRKGAGWTVLRWPDVDTSGLWGSGAIVQSNTAQNLVNEFVEVPLSAFGDSINNATYIAGMLSNDAKALAAEASLTQLTEIGPARAYEQIDAYRIGEETTPRVQYTPGTGHVWIAVACEIKAAGAPPSGSPYPPQLIVTG